MSSDDQLVPALPFILMSSVYAPGGALYRYHGIITLNFLTSTMEKHAFSKLSSEGRATSTYEMVLKNDHETLAKWKRHTYDGETQVMRQYVKISSKILDYYEQQPRTLLQLQLLSFLRKKLNSELCLGGPAAPTQEQYEEVVSVFKDLPELKALFTNVMCVPGWAEHFDSITALINKSEGNNDNF
jgi:hypothetical protein